MLGAEVQVSTRIIVGDCLSALAALDSKSVQCCVTSPPYWGLRDYGVVGQIGLEPTLGEYIARLVAVFDCVRHVLRDDGVLWLNMGDSYAAQRGGRPMPAEALAGGQGGFGAQDAHRGRAQEYQPHRNVRAMGLKHKDLIGQPWRLAFALQDAGWWLRSDVIWDKPNPMPESVTDRPTKSHEYVFLLAKSERYYYDAAAIAEPAATMPGTPDANGSTVSGGGHGCHHYGDAIPERERRTNKQAESAAASSASTERRMSGFNERWDAAEQNGTAPLKRNARTVWRIATRPFAEAHFATFPPELPRRCIAAGSRVGDLVLDPFAGAGTTLLVADQMQRDAIGIELNPEYAAIARRRIVADAPLFAPTDFTTPSAKESER